MIINSNQKMDDFVPFHVKCWHSGEYKGGRGLFPIWWRLYTRHSSTLLEWGRYYSRVADPHSFHPDPDPDPAFG
jgi:hypothetical protein